MSNDLDEQMKKEEFHRHSNFIKSISIENFKSIKSLQLKNKRINIFIGEPNTGKSNILEALGLLSAIGHRHIIRDIIRTTSYTQLFYNELLDHSIKITLEYMEQKMTNNTVELKYEEGKYRIYLNGKNKGVLFDYYPTGEHKYGTYGSGRFDLVNPEDAFYEEFYIKVDDAELYPLKYYKFRDFKPMNFRPLSNYRFQSQMMHEENPKQESRLRALEAAQEEIKRRDVLDTPYGENIYFVVANSEKNQFLIRDLLADFDLKLVLRKGANQLEVQKEQNGIIINLPLYLLADTVQSVVFYLMAVTSNKNSVMIFEEPEAHTFPFYTRSIANSIVEDIDNQYFIATHNPYFLDAIIEKGPADQVQINLVQTKNGQTIVHQLTNKQLKFLYKRDVFVAITHFDEWPASLD